MSKKTKRAIIGVLYDLTILGGLFASHYYESPFWIRVAIFFCWASALTALLVTIVVPLIEDKDMLELEIPQWRAYQTGIADIAVIVLLVGWEYTVAAAVSFIGHGANTLAYHMKMQAVKARQKTAALGVEDVPMPWHEECQSYHHNSAPCYACNPTAMENKDANKSHN